MSLDWQSYYDTVYQFWATILIQALTGCIVAFLLIQANYRFWCSKSQTSVNEPNNSTPEMRPFFKYLMISFLVMVSFYIFSSFVLRLYIIAFHGRIWCWIPDMASVFYLLSRMVLHVIFLTRLITSFSKTQFEYPRYMFVILIILIVGGSLSTGVVIVINLIQHAYDGPTDTTCVTDYNYAENATLYVVQDVIMSIVLASLFIKRLMQLIHLTNNMYQNQNTSPEPPVSPRSQQSLQPVPDMVKSQPSLSASVSIGPKIVVSPEQRNELMKQATTRLSKQNLDMQRVIQIMQVVTKFTVLLCIASLSTLLLLIIGNVIDLASGLICADGTVNAFCALYCFKLFRHEYETCCYPCHWMAFRCCVCCLFDTHDEQEESVAEVSPKTVHTLEHNISTSSADDAEVSPNMTLGDVAEVPSASVDRRKGSASNDGKRKKKERKFKRVSIQLKRAAPSTATGRSRKSTKRASGIKIRMVSSPKSHEASSIKALQAAFALNELTVPPPMHSPSLRSMPLPVPQRSASATPEPGFELRRTISRE